MGATSSLLLALLLAGNSAAGPNPDPLAAIEAAQQALFTRAAPAVVALVTPQGLGSGVIVTADGLTLTNAHVVASSGGNGHVTTLKAILSDGRVLDATVEEVAADTDLALVRLPGSGFATLPLANDDHLRVGAWAAAVGHGAGGAWTFTTGMVTNIYPSGDARPVFQTQIPVNPGNSGGPVLDRNGVVIGVVTAGLLGAESVNFAIRAEFGRSKLKGLKGLP